MDYLLLGVSACLSATRSVLAKFLSLSVDSNGKFYLTQAILFACTAVCALIAGFSILTQIKLLTVLLGLIYGAFFISSQWCYTRAMHDGPTSICGMLYAFGFVIPTLAGPIFWHDSFTVFKVIGLILVVPSILLTVRIEPKSEEQQNRKFFIPLFIAMFSSGMLGILQKIQQNSAAADQTPLFLLVGCLVAGLGSLLKALTYRKNEPSIRPAKRSCILAAIIGVAFGILNLINITLVGRMSSAVFFPVINLSSLLLCILAGTLIFHERLRLSDKLAFVFGAAAILVLNL